MAVLKYVTLLGFAFVRKDSEGRPTVLLLDEEGVSKHIDSDKLLVFTHNFEYYRVFDTVLNDDKRTPVQLVNLLAEFDENQFNVIKGNIPSLGNWDDLEQSDNDADMNPIHEPPRT